MHNTSCILPNQIMNILGDNKKVSFDSRPLDRAEGLSETERLKKFDEENCKQRRVRLNELLLEKGFPEHPPINISCEDFAVNATRGCNHRGGIRENKDECHSDRVHLTECPYASYFDKLPGVCVYPGPRPL